MDLSRRRGRGKARASAQDEGSSQQQQQPLANPPRPQIPRSQPQHPITQFQQPQVNRPNVSRKLGPPSVNAPRAQTQIQPASKQCPEKQSADSSKVEQVTEGVANLTTLEAPSSGPGRGSVRGRATNNHYRAPRPQSSLSSKQGVSGQQVQLVTNYFPIKTCPNWTLYQYRVDFNPPDDRINILRGLLHNHASLLGAYLFDGTMIFSGTKYKPDVFDLISKRNYDDQIIKITVTFSSVLQHGDYCYIQVYNLLLRNCIRHLNLQLIGRNFYDPVAKIDISKYKLQIWPGYETTIGMFDSGLMLRAEVSTKIMRQDTVLNFFEECYYKDKTNYMNLFKAGVIGTIVLTTYNNRTYKVDDVSDDATINSTFKKKDGTPMSYTDYYKEKWNLEAKNKGQPMLISKKKKVFGQDRSVEDLIYLVPEFCTLTGLSEAMRNNFNLMRELAVYTQVDPLERINRYTNFMNRLQKTPKSLENFEKWNLTLDNNLVKVPSRILPLENIYGKIESKKYDAGDMSDWTRHVRCLPMFTCGNMGNWSFICCASLNDGVINGFIHSLQSVSTSMGFCVPPPQIHIIRENSISYLLRDLENVISRYNPHFILCVLQSPRADIYNGIKRKLCVDRAIPSQVVLAKHLTKNNMSVNTKIAIQINCKLGGAPWYIDIPIKKGLMIVGFDVCHDKQNKDKSYGALVATTNDTYTSYFSCVQQHRSGQELSNNFGAIIIRAMQKYAEKNGSLPNRIIIYRDGVGDGQLSYVHKTEVDSIKALCTETYKVIPSMAFIIVKKRISTRFFLPNSRTKSYVNPPPGTVIDTTVTDPTMYDFFLVSQNTRIGTVTPTHYNVIEDTLANWSPDKMQRLTYKLTHMYYNWAGTIRVPAPCQLAHKLAFFTAQSLQTTPSVGLDDLLYFL